MQLPWSQSGAFPSTSVNIYWLLTNQCHTGGRTQTMLSYDSPHDEIQPLGERGPKSFIHSSIFGHVFYARQHARWWDFRHGPSSQGSQVRDNIKSTVDNETRPHTVNYELMIPATQTYVRTQLLMHVRLNKEPQKVTAAFSLLSFHTSELFSKWWFSWQSFKDGKFG